MPEQEIVNVYGPIEGWASRISDPTNAYVFTLEQGKSLICRSPEDDEKLLQWVYRSCVK